MTSDEGVKLIEKDYEELKKRELKNFRIEMARCRSFLSPHKERALEKLWLETCAKCISIPADVLLKEVDALIRAGVNVNAKDEYGETALCKILGNTGMFSRTGTTDNISYYFMKIVNRLDNAGADFRVKNRHGYTLLEQSYQVHIPAWRKKLIEKGVKFESQELMCAHSVEEMQVYLDAGANINCRDKYGRTPLMHWLEISPTNKTEVIDFLIRNGADLRAKDYKKQDVLAYAYMYAKDEQIAIIEQALKAESDTQIKAESQARKVTKEKNTPETGKKEGDTVFNKMYIKYSRSHKNFSKE